MKLKDYVIPQYGTGDGLGQDDLAQYSLKNFDLKTFQQTLSQPDPDPMPVPSAPYLLPQETAPEAPSPHPLSANPWSAPTGEQPDEQSFSPAPIPVQTALTPLALDPGEVQFGVHFNLQTVSYNPLSPAESWKIPRWVVTAVGLFFGSAAVLTFVCCVALLRDPKPAPTAPLAAPTAPVATTAAAPARPVSSSPVSQSAGDVPRAAVRHPAAATASLIHADAAPARRIVVSRHPSVVRRQSYGSRRVASKSTSSSVAPQETETASSRPPPDALDKLLGESAL